MKVGLTGSALRPDRHAHSACEGSIFLDARSFRPTARGDPSSGTLESCAHSKSGVCALPTCVENPVSVIAKKARAISSDTRICAPSRDSCRYRYLLGRCRGRQITHQYWHFLTASSRSPVVRDPTALYRGEKISDARLRPSDDAVQTEPLKCRYGRRAMA